MVYMVSFPLVLFRDRLLLYVRCLIVETSLTANKTSTNNAVRLFVRIYDAPVNICLEKQTYLPP